MPKIVQIMAKPWKQVMAQEFMPDREGTDVYGLDERGSVWRLSLGGHQGPHWEHLCDSPLDEVPHES